MIPAIDLLGGSCVRLRQGDFDQVTEYSDDPLEVVARFTAEGATRIHVVDLDAARDGSEDNRRIVREIVSRSDIEIEVAGGVRGGRDVAAWHELGVANVVVGTMAVEQPGALQRVASEWPGYVLVALDARGERLATHGWQEAGGRTIRELMQLFEAVPLAGFVYTDIDRDGTLAGPDLEGLGAVVAASAHPVILSGGVRGIDDLREAAAAGAWGAIVGTALYQGDVDLGAAISAVAAEDGA